MSMERIPELSLFYQRIRNDHRIGPTHISLYMAVFQLYNQNGFSNPIPINRALLMELSKISGLATYHKCIKELMEFRYIDYQPSFKSKVDSKAWILNG